MAGTNNEKPTKWQTLALEIVLALMVQWKSLVECFMECNSPEFLEKLGAILLVTISIVKPGAIAAKFAMRIGRRLWVMLGGHPLNEQTSAEMERWFLVVTSFIAQYGSVALWKWSKDSTSCLQTSNCNGTFLNYFMELRSFTCGLQPTAEASNCYYVFNHLPIALVSLTGFVIFISSVYFFNQEDTEPVKEIEVKAQIKPSKPTVSKAPADQMLNAFCPHCQKQAQIDVPLALRTIYCRNC